MPNGLKIEHLCDIIPKAQSWVVLNLPVFLFVYIHFKVPPTRITDLVRNVSDENRGENQTLVGAIPFCGEYPGPRFEDKLRSANQIDGISIADGVEIADS